ncbi:ABC transporter ATP-binding protein [Clostridium tagluense]|uniref:ABC transporter ATP-binding protein n=1 Tax=Clostridium tagluense TaxID=360422 RepID=UPI001C6E10CC|nr:ABC transporter ATP-binding protein [Clostridium tagluense]MBW9155485.1 ABC transporter ATP-binding protein [Clostridium tagluense]WLC66115.1 ABC transporter ATP-binding protein [Clostridium tagluense]
MELTLNKIYKSFGKTQILHDISATFVPGVYGLLGPNGAGKTTLMNIMTNTMMPTHGNVLWNGKDVQASGEKYREILGYLPQDVGLYPHFTGRNFLRYIATLKGLDKKQTEEKIDDLAAAVNLTDVLDKKCGKYSGGMKRRLGVAQSLLNDPKVLILDEPTAGLDPMERIRFRNMLSEIASDRIVILSTHIVSDVDRIANKVILIDKGGIIENCSTEKILNNMQGKVWESEVSNAYLNEIESKYRVANMQQKDDQILVRIISETMPTPNSINVKACLEDVYLYYFNHISKGGSAK